MQLAQALIALLAVVAVISALSRRIQVPYPILLVIGGLAVGFLPFMPQVPLAPELILLFFLPPLLYADAFQTSWIEFRRWLRSILLLSTGLVAATVFGVAAVAHTFFPELSWPAALVLGAILSPTDTVAAQAVIERLRMPRRMTAILGGESLVNDATGLLAFHFALTIALGGEELHGARFTGSVVWVLLGSVAIGLGVGWIASWLNRHVRDAGSLFALSLLAPFVAYVVCWNLAISGVLAVVVAGFYVSWRVHEVDAVNRHQLYAVWTALTFLLNGFCFVLLGLQVPQLREAFAGYDWLELASGGACVCLAVVAIRLAWVWPGTYIPRWLSKRIREREPAPPPRAVFIVGWCGMRGVVSLAAALSVPHDMPGRDVIVFCTLCTILGTLVVQGLTLAPLIRAFGIGADELTENEERQARIELVRAALATLDDIACGECEIDEVRRTTTAYHERLAVLEGQEELREQLRASDRAALSRNVHLRVLETQKQKLIELRDSEVINDATQLKLQMELDLDELRLVS